VSAERQSQRLGGRYEWQPSDSVSFFPGRQVLLHMLKSFLAKPVMSHLVGCVRPWPVAAAVLPWDVECLLYCLR